MQKLDQKQASASVIASKASQQVQVLSESTLSGDLSTVAANFWKQYLLSRYTSYYHILHIWCMAQNILALTIYGKGQKQTLFSLKSRRSIVLHNN